MRWKRECVSKTSGRSADVSLAKREIRMAQGDTTKIAQQKREKEKQKMMAPNKEEENTPTQDHREVATPVPHSPMTPDP